MVWLGLAATWSGAALHLKGYCAVVDMAGITVCGMCSCQSAAATM